MARHILTRSFQGCSLRLHCLEPGVSPCKITDPDPFTLLPVERQFAVVGHLPALASSDLHRHGPPLELCASCHSPPRAAELAETELPPSRDRRPRRRTHTSAAGPARPPIDGRVGSERACALPSGHRPNSRRSTSDGWGNNRLSPARLCGKSSAATALCVRDVGDRT